MFLFLEPCKFGSEISKVAEISIASGASWMSWKPHLYSFRHTATQKATGSIPMDGMIKTTHYFYSGVLKAVDVPSDQ